MYHLEYIWIGGNDEFRSKSKIMKEVDLENLPEWNFDGSSTDQAFDTDTEVLLKPVKVIQSPFRLENGTSYLVLCETFRYDKGERVPLFYRETAKAIFDVNPSLKPWFGLEQEYFMVGDSLTQNTTSQGPYYCGVGGKNALERKIAMEHLDACLYAGLEISGINAEVAHCQWEFQIGPCVGIDASDQLLLARYILERIAETYNVRIVYEPKPFQQVNGSGCHVNFSTQEMREEDGLSLIEKSIHKLSVHHQKVIAISGKNNHLRLTGIHETSSMDCFTWGIGTRHTSIRIPNEVFKHKKGYFEDRRFAANVNPYLATSLLFKICCLDE
jgi:glutamine synthetase